MISAEAQRRRSNMESYQHFKKEKQRRLESEKAVALANTSLSLPASFLFYLGAPATILLTSHGSLQHALSSK